MKRIVSTSICGMFLIMTIGITVVSGAPVSVGSGHYSGSSGRNTLSSSEGSIDFLAVNGISIPTPPCVDDIPCVDDDGLSLSPNVACTARDLSVLVWLQPGGTATRTFTVWANGDTAVACTVGSGDFTCNSGNATAVIPEGSMISLKASVTGTGDAVEAGVHFGFRCLVEHGQH